MATREEGLAEMERLDEMALRRISHKHTEEQVGRGFNILTNGGLPNSLQMIREEKQEYLKKPAHPFEHTAMGKTSQS